ncbi:MAG TPA: RNA methyltransferase [Acidimicrobiales bacterium]|nr:RNA methyltransferase [Acidimicrobiales bacterium]
MQRLRRLAARRSAREVEGCFVVEGGKVVREALAAGVGIESLYVDRSGLPSVGAGGGVLDLVEDAYAAGIRVFDLAPGVLARVADTVTPQPVMAIVERMDVPLATLQPSDQGDTIPLIVVCVDVRDPGNAGTILRSAEAAGASGVVCCDGTVDVFSPKTVRASAGSVFRVPVVAGGDPVAVLAELGRWGLARLATVAHGGQSYSEADLTVPVALVLGNEAHGLPDDVAPELDGRLTIPMAGRAESLNAGMAAAVICFEAARQRRQLTPGAPNPGAAPPAPAGAGAPPTPAGAGAPAAHASGRSAEPLPMGVTR